MIMIDKKRAGPAPSHEMKPNVPTYQLPPSQSLLTRQDVQLPGMKDLLRVPKFTARAQKMLWTEHTGCVASDRSLNVSVPASFSVG